MRFKLAQIADLPGVYPDYGKLLNDAGFNIEFRKKACGTEDEIIDFVDDSDAVICVSTLQDLSRVVFDNLRNCKFIQSIGIGFEKMDVKAASDNCILAANVPDFCLEEVSEHTIGLILALTRGIVKLNSIVKAGEWNFHPDPEIQKNIWPKLVRINKLKLGLIGFGQIPRALVPNAKGFNLEIMAYDPYADRKSFDDLGVVRVELDQLLIESDIVSVHCPLTDETKHMIGSRELEKMKPSAYLINTARGPVIDTDALYSALSNGKLAGAGLDVIEPEPIPKDHPLLKLDNVIITAHGGGVSNTSIKMLMMRPYENIVRLLKGEWPTGLLNPEIKDEYTKKWGNSVCQTG